MPGTRVYIFLDPMYRGEVEGLCGDYNGVADDDFKGVKDGHVFTKAQDFGNHWKTSESCSNIDDSMQDWDPCKVGVVFMETDFFVIIKN